MASYDDTATVSGSVVGFNNGADDVPTKSLVVTIPPTLSGVSSVTETQTGRNLLDVPAREELTRNGVISSVASDGTITASGQSTGNGDIPITLGTSANLIGGQTYTFSINGTDTRTGSVYVYFAGGSYISINNANHSGTYTPSADQTITGVTLRMFNGQSITFSAKIMLEYGSTAHTYEPYQTPTTYTAQLGRTIYGGEVDIVNGTGKEQYQKVKVSDLTWQKSTASGKDFFIANISEQENANTHDVAIDITGLTYAGMVTIAAMNDKSLAKWLQSVRIYDTSVSTVSDLLSTYGNGEIVFYLKDTEQTDFTFDGQEIPTRLGVNNFWSEQGDTELTYYKSGYGFTSVTVNKTGKNLFGGWTKGYGVNSTTGKIFSRQDSAISDYISVVPNTNYYISGFSNEISSMVAYYDRNKTYISRTSGSQRLSLAVTTPTNCRYMILYQYRAGDQTASIDVIDNMQTQLELGSQATEYEPYEVVSKTAYLHKVIYGGTADVIRGTCEPKNLFDLNNANLVDGYISTTSFNTGNSKAKTIYIPINANTTYTVSKTAGQRFQIATSDVIPTNGATYTERVAQSGQQTSLTITSGSNDKYLWAWVFLQDTDTGTLADMLSSVQIEKGSSASEYVPGFTQFTFPPISMSTDEGENTLFANEGDSAITYRKAVD